eukprot:1149400-Pelagomonas_calceolata.AAC.2
MLLTTTNYICYCVAGSGSGGLDRYKLAILKSSKDKETAVQQEHQGIHSNKRTNSLSARAPRGRLKQSTNSMSATAPREQSKQSTNTLSATAPREQSKQSTSTLSAIACQHQQQQQLRQSTKRLTDSCKTT